MYPCPKESIAFFHIVFDFCVKSLVLSQRMCHRTHSCHSYTAVSCQLKLQFNAGPSIISMLYKVIYTSCSCSYKLKLWGNMKRCNINVQKITQLQGQCYIQHSQHSIMLLYLHKKITQIYKTAL